MVESAPTQMKSHDNKVIITTGYGIDKEKALKNAFKSAIEQYVGVVVDADTIVENGEMIKDEILTASNGYIQEYEELSTENSGGLVEIKIRATVKSQKVFNKIKSLNIATIKLDGIDDAYKLAKNQESKVKNKKAKVLTQIIAKKDAEQILRKSFKKFLSAESVKEMLTISITSVDVDSKSLKNDKVPVTVAFAIAFDEKIYGQKLVQLGQTFENLGAKLHQKIDFPFIENGTLNVKLKHKVEKLTSTDIGFITTYGKSFRLDVWEFPKEWSDIHPFSGSVSIVFQNNFDLILGIKKRNGDLVYNDKITTGRVYEKNTGRLLSGSKAPIKNILTYYISNISYVSSRNYTSGEVLAPIFLQTKKMKKVSSFSQKVWLDLEDIKNLDAVSIHLEIK